MFQRLHPRVRAADHHALIRARSGDSALASALAKATKWLSFAHSSTTITGSGYSSVADVLGGSAATQSTDARRPVSGTANGYPIATFTDDFLSLPLDASINDNVKYGVAMWVKIANTVGSKILTSIQNFSGGASADKMLHFVSGSAIQARAMSVDRRVTSGALDTGWHFLYLGTDGSKGSESAQALMGIDAALQVATFSSDTAWPSTLGTPTGNLLIGANSTAAANPLVGSVGTDIWFLQSQLTVAEQAALMRMRPPTALSASLAANIVCLGNSITLGLGLSAGQDFPSVMATSLGANYRVANSGQSGFTTAQLTTNFASLVQAHYDGRAGRNILVVNEVGNDLVSGGGGGGVSEATAQANMQALIAMGRFYGWIVLFATTTPRDGAHFTAGQQASADNINDFFRNNPSERDGFIDWAAAPELSDPTDTTYYQDGVHPTAAGAAVIASLTEAAIT